MKAIILAAGYATRLYPLTLTTAKPLLAVKGKPIINHIVDKLNDCKEIDEIFVVTNNKFYSQFETWHKTVQTKKKIQVLNDGTVENGARLGAIGDIDYVIRSQHISDDLMVIAGDNLFSFSLNDFISFFRKKQTSLVAIYDTQDPLLIANRLGCVTMNAEGRIVEFVEKPMHPKTTLAATACYLFSKQQLHYVSAALQHHNDRPGELVKFISEKAPVFGFAFKGYWYDIGSPEEYARVNAAQLSF